MESCKRVSFNRDIQPVDPLTRQLQTLGMRIRKSVSDGYMQGDASAASTAHKWDELTAPQIRRVPLPDHLASGPPALDYRGSTASSLADWESELDRGTKRTFDETQDYEKKYGPLVFNEEF
ncbi:hypothetical protein KL906_005012 [Ogataea polymorpha]|nr:hypothetical protein KL906_005012 [Ogataea polymorpha]